MGSCEADMGLHERAVIGLESQAVSAQVTVHFITIFSKTCNKEKKKDFSFVSNFQMFYQSC